MAKDMPIGKDKSDWLCIQCGHSLGRIVGGELYPTVAGEHTHTSGPNLVVICPECGARKVFFTSDPIVKAVYQLVNAVAAEAAHAMIAQMGKAVHKQDQIS